MEISQLCSVLQISIGSNNEERKKAEEFLKEHKTTKGVICMLLRIAIENSIDSAVRQAAAILLKRNIEKHWEIDDDDKDKSIRYHPEDKQELKMHLIDAIMQSAPLIRSQLLEVLKTIVYVDFPDKWPGLPDKIIHIINIQDEHQLLSALMIFRCLCVKFEYNDSSEAVNQLMQQTALRLLDILRTLTQINSSDVLYANLLKTTCKIFWAVSYFKLPPILLEPTYFNSLMDSLLILLQKPLPFHEMPSDHEEQDSWEWWKAEKWVLSLTKRYFKFNEGKLKKTDTEQHKFRTQYSKYMYPMLEAHLKLLETISQLPRPNDRILILLLHIMDIAVAIKTTFKALKDHILPMLKSIIFPLLCFSEDDAILMETDPEEYIRKYQNCFEDIFGVKAAASHFLFEVCKNYKKLYLHEFMNFIGSILTDFYNAASSGNVSVKLSRKMDGALFSLGSLSNILMKKAYRKNIEEVLFTHVMLCFQSPYPHLRSRACWIAKTYSSLKFSDGEQGKGNAFKLLLEKVIELFQDPQLTVKMDAVVALSDFIKVIDSLDDIKRVLPDLLTIFFKLMNEIESENIVNALETIVYKFDSEISPYALDLTRNFVSAFFKSYEQARQDEEDEETENCCFGCIRAINTLLDATQNNPELYAHLEELIYPVIVKLLDDNSQELFEDVLDMISYLLYFGKSISARMWDLWPRLHHLLFAWAIEYYDFVYVSLEVYIIKGKDTFLNNKEPSYIESFNQILAYSFLDEFSEPTCHPSLKLIEIAMQNLKPNIDVYIKPYLQLTLSKLSNAQRSDTKVLCLNVLANALWYNVPLTLQSLKELNSFEAIFKTWMEMIYTDKKNGKLLYFKKMSDKKVNIMGLCSILQTPDEVLGPELVSGLNGVFLAIIRLLSAIKEQEEEEMMEDEDETDKSTDEEYISTTIDEEDTEEDEEDEDDEIIDDKIIETDSGTSSSTYKKLIEKKVKSIFGTFGDSDSDDYCYSDVSSDDEDAPIYNINIFDSFFQSINYLEGNNQKRLLLIKDKLSAEHMGNLAMLTAYSDERKRGREKSEEAKNEEKSVMNGNS